MGLAPVGMGFNMGNASPVAFQKRGGLIGGSAILDHEFQSRVVLRQNTLDGAFQEAALVERGRDDGDCWRRRVCFSLVIARGNVKRPRGILIVNTEPRTAAAAEP